MRSALSLILALTLNACGDVPPAPPPATPARVDNGLSPQPLNPYPAPRDGGAAHD